MNNYVWFILYVKLKNKTRTTLRIKGDYWEQENVAGKGRCL